MSKDSAAPPPGAMTRFRVVPQEGGLSLRNLLSRRLPQLDRRRAADLIRAGGVYVNRLRVRVPSVIVVEGERITVYPAALDAAPLDPETLVFVHRGEDFVILDKPAGVPVSATRETSVGSLSQALVHRLESEGVRRPYVGLVHRLDRGASGLVLFTIRGVANKSLHQQFREHRVERCYRIRVRGEAPESLRCDAPLIRLASGVKIGSAADGHALPATTHFRRLAQLADGEAPEALLEATLETGRTHQIRAHAAHLGLPVLGDRRYGNPDDRGERLHLHAHRLAFAHPLTKQALRFESTLPAWARGPGEQPSS